jgi:dienelactone hydrolase
MSDETFMSGVAHKIAIYPAAVYGEKRPILLVLHGNAGLNPPFGSQIHSFAKSLAELGYVTAVPQYYADDNPHLQDQDPHPKVQKLTDAIKKVAERSDANVDQLGLVGYSLGAATAMTYIASNSPGKVKVLVDFFGPIAGNAAVAAEVAKFPPTIIFHDNADKIVSPEDSRDLAKLLVASAIRHELHAYDEPLQSWQAGANHAFQKGGKADLDSRKRATEWLLEHLPPPGSN